MGVTGIFLSDKLFILSFLRKSFFLSKLKLRKPGEDIRKKYKNFNKERKFQ